MKENQFHRMARQSWPDFVNQPEQIQQHVTLIFTAVVFLFPFFILSTGWLILMTDWQVVAAYWPLLGLLFVLVAVMDQNQYSVTISLKEGLEMPFSGSLSSILIIASLFIWGPTVLWLPWLSGVLVAAEQAWNNNGRGQNLPRWLPLNVLVQMSGITILHLLIMAALYQWAGGVYPLTGPQPADWLPAFIAIVVGILLPVFFYLPLLYLINQAAGGNDVWVNPASVTLIIMVMSLVVDPFAIPLAITYSAGGLTVFLFLCAGVLLAHLLAANLSKANDRHRARARELKQLEALSQAIIAAPADASTLADILAAHLTHFFPMARLSVTLYANNEQPRSWPLFTFATPDGFMVDAAVWQELQQSEADYLVRRKQPLAGSKRYFGDKFLLKILVASDDGLPACVGGIYVHRPRSPRKPADVLPTLQELAGQIGVTLYRAQAHAETVAHQKVTQELEFAGRIQASFLPRELPQVPGWDIAAALVPARQTSGDFYDFVELGHGRVGLIVADVADKGTGAALYMALSRTLIRTYAMQYPNDPGQALMAANERILADTESDQFVTVFYAILEAKTGQLFYANAGHNPAFVFGESVQALPRTGIPLGMFAGMKWETKKVQMCAGDRLVIYSDGVTEAQNETAEEFGEARLQTAVQAGNGHATETQQAVITAVQSFTGAAPQFDDITLLIAQRLSA